MSVKRYVLDESALTGGMEMFEDDDGDYILHSDYATIEEERDKLAREVMRLVNINEQLHDRHNALREAVAWERECIRQLDYVGKFWDDDNVPGRELIMILDAARAEVDRLLSEES